MDGTLAAAWAGQKSFRRKREKQAALPDDPGHPTVKLDAAKRFKETHGWTTGPVAKPAGQGEGQQARLSYGGNLLVEDRPGLMVNAGLLEANGAAERDAALVRLEQLPGTPRLKAPARRTARRI